LNEFLNLLEAENHEVKS